jgi:4-diphosphocytidyl-2-C-methyl-D-erythritol kinase
MLRLRAPAKLNLYLRVLGKRPDGFHEIETLFERIDLADELTCEPAQRLALTCTDLSAVAGGTGQAGPALSCGEDNLVLKAARLLQRAAGTRQGARLHLLKRIPVAAGLGGGSSDAAAALLGLNQLWGLGLPRVRLGALAAELGSDVPFFLTEAAFAIGRGRGEVCEPLADIPPLAHVLVVPAERLSTREIYGGARLRLTAGGPSITMVAHALRNGPDMAGLAHGLRNDLEPEAIRRCPVIETILACLRDLGCAAARMSGSGSSVFGLCSDAAHAKQIARRLSGLTAPQAASWTVEVVQTVRNA